MSTVELATARGAARPGSAAAAAPLQLYTVFHANLGFSSVPYEHDALIVDRCFWPVVALCADDPLVRLGIELPAATLARIDEIDRSLVAEIARLQQLGRIEVVASGLTQAIAPLMPAIVNEANLAAGDRLYGELLGQVPTVAYANEQTISHGGALLYAEHGYRALVVDWENTAQAAHLDPQLRWCSPTVAGSDLALLWASTVLFQRVQRVAYGELDAADVAGRLVQELVPPEGGARPVCLYSNDWEVFDYTPGQGPPPELHGSMPAGTELPRLLQLVRLLATDPAVAFVLPSEVVDRFASPTAVQLGSASAPLITKKQPKYNPSRWAVGGDRSVAVNTACTKVATTLERAATLAAAPGEPPVPTAELALAWGSDLRTHTNQDKAEEFEARIGVVASAATALLARRLDGATAGLGAPARRAGAGRPNVTWALVNTSGGPWPGWPITIDVRLPPWQVRGKLVVRSVRSGRSTPVQQVERIERSPAGWVRAATITVAGIAIGAGETVEIEIIDDATSVLEQGAGDVIGPCFVPIAGSVVDAGAVVARFAPRRGGTLAELTFPAVADHPLAGAIPHGTLEPIHLTPDWYTANTVVVDENGQQQTDLGAATLLTPADPGAFPVRVPVLASVGTPLGTVWKTYWLHRLLPRVDLDVRIAMKRCAPISVRSGILSLLPDAFDAAQLAYTTINGATRPDRYPLAAEVVRHGSAVSPVVSASMCPGATDGWLAVDDERHGVAVIIDQAVNYGVPLVEHEPISASRSFVRIQPSFGESDETGRARRRGHTRFCLAYEGFAGSALDHWTAWHQRRLGVSVVPLD